MSLRDLIRKKALVDVATATPATFATDGPKSLAHVARVATVAVANPPESATSTPEDERVGLMITKLEHDSGLQYAIETHTEAEPDAVILTVAIRGKGACELRIPKSRYDAFALLELIEQHTVPETLQ